MRFRGNSQAITVLESRTASALISLVEFTDGRCTALQLRPAVTNVDLDALGERLSADAQLINQAWAQHRQEVLSATMSEYAVADTASMQVVLDFAKQVRDQIEDAEACPAVSRGAGESRIEAESVSLICEGDRIVRVEVSLPMGVDRVRQRIESGMMLAINSNLERRDSDVMTVMEIAQKENSGSLQWDELAEEIVNQQKGIY